ncbi:MULTISPECIES: hypothetical protein [unclassified Azospirillum]|uniref:hypothetical protein n=1 Tax=unclassified Azospirillum TaxID=2630922 RepID=UPI000B682866|nr:MULTISPECIES: hypothetical protein [unclassified Azospirillum]SNS83715.1 hypothetical protein SAMN05880556_11322 [Azospirillum sp. RU38E]SNT00908.1 hypothetical protein SAMN05880591_11321 [Azospirillum sp. RU37A]
MRLLTPQTIRAALGVDDAKPFNDAIGTALDTASSRLATELRTPFAFSPQQQDIFYIDRLFTQGRLAQVELCLSRGLLRPDKPVLVEWSDDLLFTSPQPVANAYQSLNYDKGLLTLLDGAVQHRFVRVTYAAGIDTLDDVYADPDLLPGWLADAARLHVTLSLQNHPLFRDHDRAVDYKLMAQQLQDILAGQLRYRPSALRPIR